MNAVSSNDAVTTREPSGLNATLFTLPVCPEKTARGGAGYRIPQSRSMVLRRGGQVGTIRAEHRAAHRTCMASKDREYRTTLCIP